MRGRADNYTPSGQPAVVRMERDIIAFAHKNLMRFQSLFRAILSMVEQRSDAGRYPNYTTKFVRKLHPLL